MFRFCALKCSTIALLVLVVFDATNTLSRTVSMQSEAMIKTKGTNAVIDTTAPSPIQPAIAACAHHGHGYAHQMNVHHYVHDHAHPPVPDLTAR